MSLAGKLSELCYFVNIVYLAHCRGVYSSRHPNLFPQLTHFFSSPVVTFFILRGQKPFLGLKQSFFAQDGPGTPFSSPAPLFSSLPTEAGNVNNRHPWPTVNVTPLIWIPIT